VFRDEGHVDTAIAYYRESIRLSPVCADTYSNLGCVLKESNKVEEAIWAYENAIRLRPDFAIAHANIGACYYERGDIPAAIAAFKNALHLQPVFPDCLVSILIDIIDYSILLRHASRSITSTICAPRALVLTPTLLLLFLFLR
jgi:tetratricopeptide (TPR) repeat protein